MKNFKKILAFGIIAILFIVGTPAQKAKADAGVTLGIIGTALGATSLGWHIKNHFDGTYHGHQAVAPMAVAPPAYYPAPMPAPMPMAAPMQMGGGCCGGGMPIMQPVAQAPCSNCWAEAAMAPEPEMVCYDGCNCYLETPRYQDNPCTQVHAPGHCSSHVYPSPAATVPVYQPVIQPVYGHTNNPAPAHSEAPIIIQAGGGEPSHIEQIVSLGGHEHAENHGTAVRGLW